MGFIRHLQVMGLWHKWFWNGHTQIMCRYNIMVYTILRQTIVRCGVVDAISLKRLIDFLIVPLYCKDPIV